MVNCHCILSEKLREFCLYKQTKRLIMGNNNRDWIVRYMGNLHVTNNEKAELSPPTGSQTGFRKGGLYSWKLTRIVRIF